MNKLLILLIAAFGCSCRTLSPQYSASPGRSLVQGESMDHKTETTPVPSWSTQVRIYMVDGEHPFGPYHSGKKVWLEPGIHTLMAECTTLHSWGKIMQIADMQINVQPGFIYSLTSSPIISSTSKEKPHIEVAKQPIK